MLNQLFYDYFLNQELITLIFLFLTGIFLLFVGNRLEKITFAIIGFIIGYYFFHEYLYHFFTQYIGHLSIPIIAFSIFGGIIGMLFPLFVRTMVILLFGAALGYFLCLLLISSGIIPNDILFWVISILIFVLLAHFLYKIIIIITTSFIGAIIITCSSIAMLTEFFPALESSKLIKNPMILLIIIGILTLIGSMEQKKTKNK